MHAHPPTIPPTDRKVCTVDAQADECISSVVGFSNELSAVPARWDGTGKHDQLLLSVSMHGRQQTLHDHQHHHHRHHREGAHVSKGTTGCGHNSNAYLLRCSTNSDLRVECTTLFSLELSRTRNSNSSAPLLPRGYTPVRREQPCSAEQEETPG
jgi:hypothetical protein